MLLLEKALEIKSKIDRGDLSIGILAPTEVDRMHDLLQESAKNGNATAWFELGMCIYTGLISHEDAANEVATCFRNAGENGYGIAAWRMYVRIGYYNNPTNVTPTEVKDVIDRYIIEDTTGELALFKGYMLLKGYGYKEDVVASAKAHLFAANQGNAEAMFEMYIYYHFGYGVEEDLDTAAQWCLKAAKKGNKRALYNMGTMRASGYGAIHKDINEAVAWYKKASEAGHGRASATLALMYSQGTEVSKNLEKAKYYFKQADDNDYGIEAEVMLEDLMDIPEDWF